MNISQQEEGKIIIKVLRKRLFGNKDREIAKANNEELFYENLQLKKVNVELKARNEEIEKTFKEWAKNNWIELPKLVINEKKKVFTFISSEIIKTYTFTRIDTNEYKLLMYFVNHLFISCPDKLLNKVLNDPREQANPYSKRRVLDTISSLRNKFGKDIILDLPGGLHAFFGETSFQE